MDVVAQISRAAAGCRACRSSSGACVTPCRNGRRSSTGAIQRARQRLAHAAGRRCRLVLARRRRRPSEAAAPDLVRLLAPFDPVVHDRARFERLWGWTYRFEAYTPAGSAQARLLRAAAALARPGHRLWEHLGEGRRARCRRSATSTRRPPRDRAFKARARGGAGADAPVPRA